MKNLMNNTGRVAIQVSKKFKNFTVEELKKNDMKILNITEDVNKIYIKLEYYPVKIKSLLKTDWEMV